MAGNVVIGIGNPLRGDDGLGPAVAESVSRAPWARKATVITCHQLVPELTEPLSGADLAVFIDARANGQPGTIVCETVEPSRRPPAGTSHHFGPSLLLAAVQQLCGRCPRAFAVSLCGESFGYDERLSAPVTRALPRVVLCVHRLMAGRPAPLHDHRTTHPGLRRKRRGAPHA